MARKGKKKSPEKMTQLVYAGFAIGQISILYEIYHSIATLSAPSWPHIVLSIVAISLGIAFALANGLTTVAVVGALDLLSAVALGAAKIHIENEKKRL
jgi:hypothetical protein